MNRDLFRDIAQLIIAIALIAGGFLFLYKVFLSGNTIPAELKDSLFQVTGGVIALISGIAGYYFGSSLSSARKDTTIATAATKVNP